MPVLRSRTRASGAIPTSSMADIAFLLLVFFLVTTIFDEEKGLPLVLPEAEKPIEVTPSNVLHLVIRATGLVEVRRGASPHVQTAAASDIAGIWAAEHRRNPHLIAAVKTAPAAPYRLMIDVLDQLQAAGADRVNLDLLEGDGR